MNLGLKEKPVIVMAASGGIGKATALEFAREEANVMMFARSEERLRQAQDEIADTTGVRPSFTAGDITRYDDIKRVVSETSEKFGSIFALVNNTGGPPAGTFDAFDDDAWQKAFELTLLGFIRSIREVVPIMKQAGSGRIVNYTSSSSKQIIDNLILSNTFRLGVVGLTKTLARELGPVGILINVMGPGRIETDRLRQIESLWAGQRGISVEELQQGALKEIPLGRYGSPEEYARLAVFLCSEANTYVTGQTILVDGGMVKAY